MNLELPDMSMNGPLGRTRHVPPVTTGTPTKITKTGANGSGLTNHEHEGTFGTHSNTNGTTIATGTPTVTAGTPSSSR